jgi:hypothetical protein
MFGLAACNFENYEDCQDDELELDDDWGGHSKAGKGPSEPGSGATGSGATGSGATGSGATGSGGSAGSGSSPAEGGTPGEPEPMEPPPTACEAERDCDAGYNCDLEAGVCAPADAETCGELVTEQECSSRTDCTPIYGGTNCSCGADCECMGGEPGCICESFEFFVCRPAEAAEQP